MRSKSILFAALACAGLVGCSGSSSTSSSNGVTATTFRAPVSSINDTVVTSFTGVSQSVSNNDRSINWDGTAVTNITNNTTVNIARDFFTSTNGARQIFIGAPNEQIIVSENAFANIPGIGANPSAGLGFAPLTGTANFSVTGSNSITISFTQTNTAKAGLVHGFGCVFTDVETANLSGLRFYDAAGELLGQIFALPQNTGQHQFVGAVFSDAVVATVIIDCGNNQSFGTVAESPSTGGPDHVVLDDFLFFESETTAFPDFEFAFNVATVNDQGFLDVDIRRASLGTAENINWDGGAVTAITQNGTAAFTPTLFNNPANTALDRQILIGGSSLDMPFVSQDSFATINGNSNPSAGNGFNPFTGTVNFAPVGGNTISLTFTDVTGNKSGLIHGMGVVFTDVEISNKSGLRFYRADGTLIRDVRCPAGSNNGHQFVGAIFEEAIVAQVIIDFADNDTFGTAAENIGANIDHVVVDDFRFFLSGTDAPIVELSGAVTNNNDTIIQQFDLRRLPLALGNEQNINWDGAAVTNLTMGGTANFPANLFNNAAVSALDRQIEIGSTGQDVDVSENNFATLATSTTNPSGGNGTDALSPAVNVTTIGGDQLTINFFQTDTVTAGEIRGFGAIFTDVERNSVTMMRFFDVNSTLLRTVAVDAANSGEHQFVGVIFPEAILSRVEITMGQNTSFGTNAESPPNGDDHIALDDFFFFKDPR